MKKFFHNLSLALALLSTAIFCVIIYAVDRLPNNYIIYENQNSDLNIFPYFIKTENTARAEISCNTQKNNLTSKLSFLNIIPIKKVLVNTSPERYVIPCGTPFGAKIYTNGIIVIDTPENQNLWGVKNFSQPKLQKGDVILKADGESINSTDQFESIINASKGRKILLTVTRNKQQIVVPITPKISENGRNYCAGIWVRDSCAGIGTLTFLNPTDNMFAGLGHGICDVDTGNILSVFKGEITEASIISVKKGEPGLPGELKGCFSSSNNLGEIYSNGDTGLYGKLVYNLKTNLNPMKIAPKQNIKTGEAKILTTVSESSPHFYTVNIDSVNYNINSPTKNIRITVTDPDLLQKTGGIVQGMSGSPIIQNDMIVGAITHVLVNDPSKGYGIFAETMITNSDDIFKFHHKNKK